jgi:hypothetical protein
MQNLAIFCGRSKQKVTNSDGRTVERRKQFLTIKTDKRLGMTKGFGGNAPLQTIITLSISFKSGFNFPKGLKF